MKKLFAVALLVAATQAHAIGVAAHAAVSAAHATPHVTVTARPAPAPIAPKAVTVAPAAHAATESHSVAAPKSSFSGTTVMPTVRTTPACTDERKAKKEC